jgi:hypothetical protein
MPHGPNAICSRCEKPVYRGPTSRPEIVCWDCRRKEPGQYERKKPLKQPPSPRPCEYEQCGKMFTPQPRTKGKPPQRFCSLKCASLAGATGRPRTTPEQRKQRGKNRARKRRLRLNAVPWDGIIDTAILDRDKWTCKMPVCLFGSRRIYKSRKYPDERSPSVDHIVPLSLGGDDTQWNKRAAHLGCNMTRQNQPDDQMPLDFGASFDVEPRFLIRQSRQWRDCEICGERVGRTVRCKRHTRVVWCRVCSHAIPNATSGQLTCATCIQAQVAAAAERKRLKVKATCLVADCPRPRFGQGYCAPHYFRLKKHGDVRAHIPVASTHRERYEVSRSA